MRRFRCPARRADEALRACAGHGGLAAGVLRGRDPPAAPEAGVLRYPSWAWLWLHLSWRPAKPKALAVAEATHEARVRAGRIIQRQYRRHHEREEARENKSVVKDNKWMGSPEDPIAGRRLKLLLYFVLLVFFTLASIDARRPDKYQQTAVLHTHLALSNDLESPPKSFMRPGGLRRALQTGEDDEQEKVVDPAPSPDLPTGSSPQFTELRTRAHLRLYLGQSLRRAAVELAQSGSKLPFHLVTVMRVRQQRVAPEPCPSGIFEHISAAALCHPNFADGQEDRSAFGPEGQWEYTDGAEVGGYNTDVVRGKLASYDAGGFLLETFLPEEAEEEGSQSGSWAFAPSPAPSSGRRALKGAKKGKAELVRTAGPWADAEAFDMWATAGGVPWDETVAKHWIDAQTRAVMIDLAVYNPSLRIVTAVSLLAEISDTGQVIPSYVVNTMRRRRFFDVADPESWYEWALLLLVALLTAKALYEASVDARELQRWVVKRSKKLLTEAKSSATVAPAEMAAVKPRMGEVGDEQDALEKRIRMLGEIHSRRVWRLIDLLNYALFIVPLAMEGWGRLLLHLIFKEVTAMQTAEHDGSATAQNSSSAVIDDVNVSHLDHVSFSLPSSLSRMATTLLAVNAVITWSKMVKYLSAFPYIGMLSLTLQHAYFEVLCFLILFFIVFVGCGFAFTMTFGGQMQQYSSPPHAMMSLFRCILGDFEYEDMSYVDPTFGPVIFVVYIILVSFLLANMFIALLSNSYHVAKVSVMGDFAAEQDKDKWAGAEPFVAYVWRHLTQNPVCKPLCEKRVSVAREKQNEAIEAGIVWIGGIPANVHEAALQRLLSRFGALTTMPPPCLHLKPPLMLVYAVRLRPADDPAREAGAPQILGAGSLPHERRGALLRPGWGGRPDVLHAHGACAARDGDQRRGRRAAGGAMVFRGECGEEHPEQPGRCACGRVVRAAVQGRRPERHQGQGGILSLRGDCAHQGPRAGCGAHHLRARAGERQVWAGRAGGEGG